MADAQKKCKGGKWLADESSSFIKAHKLECDFYKDIAPILRAPIPKVFHSREWIYGQQEGYIHMEDLTLRGKTLSYFDNINLSQVKSFIRVLARMNKNCLVADPKVWKGKFLHHKELEYKQILIVFNKMGNAFMEKSSMKGESIVKVF